MHGSEENPGTVPIDTCPNSFREPQAEFLPPEAIHNEIPHQVGDTCRYGGGNQAQEKCMILEIALILLLAHFSCAVPAPVRSISTNIKKLAERARYSPAQLTIPELTWAHKADPQTLLIRPKAFQFPANLLGRKAKSRAAIYMPLSVFKADVPAFHHAGRGY